MEVLTHDCHDGAGGSDAMKETGAATGGISQWESITRERDIDSLNPSTGIVLGCLIGIALWLILAILIMAF